MMLGEGMCMPLPPKVRASLKSEQCNNNNVYVVHYAVPEMYL